MSNALIVTSSCCNLQKRSDKGEKKKDKEKEGEPEEKDKKPDENKEKKEKNKNNKDSLRGKKREGSSRSLESLGKESFRNLEAGAKPDSSGEEKKSDDEKSEKSEDGEETKTEESSEEQKADDKKDKEKTKEKIKEKDKRRKEKRERRQALLSFFIRLQYLIFSNISFLSRRSGNPFTLGRGEFPFSKDKGNQKLYHAIKMGDIETVKILLESDKAYINSRDENGVTPLIQCTLLFSLPFFMCQ